MRNGPNTGFGFRRHSPISNNQLYGERHVISPSHNSQDKEHLTCRWSRALSLVVISAATALFKNYSTFLSSFFFAFFNLQNNSCSTSCLFYDTRQALVCSCMISKPFSLTFKSKQYTFEFILCTMMWQMEKGLNVLPL